MPTRQALDGYKRLIIKAIVVACQDAQDTSNKWRATEARNWLFGDGMMLAMFLDLDHDLHHWLTTLESVNNR